jgi:membrane protein YqaA with SNARE-associated domain
MNYQELYSLIFIDSFVANIVFCFANEIAVETVRFFNHYNIGLIIIVASSASILAYYIDYLFGRVVFQIVKPFQQEDGKIATEQFRKLSENNYFKILLMISALTIYGKFTVFFAGFARINCKYIMLMTLVMRPIYYSYMLLI